ncbi:MAG: hypothetical protein JXA54_06175 [Candidatus Heimdallarchaeota archaeon]|nr:hypothetical protein [Candidatus Heimdallarchaeota archaeon]
MINMDTLESLDKFGKFICENFRDSAIDFCYKLLDGRWKAASLQKIENELQNFTQEQKLLITKCVVASIDTAIHDFLFAYEETSQTSNDIQILIDNLDLNSLSDNLREEPFVKKGWFEKFSRYKIDF